MTVLSTARLLPPLAASLLVFAPCSGAFTPIPVHRRPHLSRPPVALAAAAGPKDDTADAAVAPASNDAKKGAGPRGESSVGGAAGPRGESRRRRTSSRGRTPDRRRRRSSASPSSGPAATRTQPAAAAVTTTTPRKRAPHQFDHTKEEARPFVDALTEIQSQPPNEDAVPLDLSAAASSYRDSTIILPPGKNGDLIAHAHVETRSLDDLFPSLDFSRLFATSTEFRTALRGAIREDVFDTTPAYGGMSDKARRMLLLPDSSLQGSWRCEGGGWVRPSAGTAKEDGGEEGKEGGDDGATSGGLRMKKLTHVLREYLGASAPTGDEFMDTIGSLCGSRPSTHWIDIVGVLDRRVPHSWHQDAPSRDSKAEDTKTVLLGFPPTDDYDGVGVFSHVIKLRRERWAADGHPPNEPVLFGGLGDADVDLERHVVRPRYAEGREIILYRDVDVLHSSPDVAYRASVMRFM